MTADALTIKGFSREAVDALAARQNEPGWLRDWRLAAWEAYEATPMPARTDEDWRRTDIRRLKLDGFAPYAAGDESAGLAQAVAPLQAELGAQLSGLLAQADSLAALRQVTGALEAQGVLVASLDRAAHEHADLVQRHLGSVVPASAGKFPALNAALWSGGAFVYVPRNVEVALPLAVLQWQATPGAALLPRTLVVLERGASLTLIVDQRSADQGEPQGEPALCNGVTELIVGENARLRYVVLQRWGHHLWNFGFERARLGRDARVDWATAALGGRLTKMHQETELTAPGAMAQGVGVVLADGTQHFDYHTLQDHQAPHTSSNLAFRSVVGDSARSVFVGLIRVDKQAQQTDAYLQNRNLLLSEKAKADAIPRLEIEANDVRCTHGATVSPVDPEQIFYLQARGLPHDRAEQMIVEGFFEPLLEAIPAESVRDRLRTALAEKVERHGG